MKIENEKLVKVIYDLSTGAGEPAIETVDISDPLTFITGKGMLLPKFEENLINKSIGDPFEFIIKTEDAYGAYNLESILDLPMSLFMSGGQPREDLLFIGNLVPVRDGSGRVMNGKVLEIGKENVKMDFNHHLAGKDLHFKGKVIEVRDSTEDDMKQFLMPEDGCGGCSCDSATCGSDCG